MSKERPAAPQPNPARRGPGGGGPAMALMPGEKPKNFKKTMNSLLKTLSPHKGKLVLVFLFAIASTLFTIISPNILGNATDLVVSGIRDGDGPDFGRLIEILLFLCALYGLSFFFSFIQGFLMADVSQKVIYGLRKSLSEKLDRLPLQYTDGKTHGEILSRFTNDIETINQTLSQSITQIITSITTLLGIVAMMVYINGFMTLVALVALPLSMITIRLVVRFSQVHFRNQQRFLGEVNSHVEEMFTGHLVVKSFNGEEDSIRQFSEINDRLAEASRKSQFLSGLMMPLTGFIGNLSYVFVCLAGGYLALKGQVSIGNIQAFLQYVRSFNQPITQAANVANVLQSTAAAAERIFEMLEEKEEAPDQEEPCSLHPNQVKGQVEFRNVHFGYGSDHLTIQDFNFTALPGQRIAIVGPTGGGKTTLVKLLMRFYELNAGQILIDGQDIQQVPRRDLRRMLSMVLQDTWLFSGSLRENIRYGNSRSSDEDVIEAAKAAHIHHFINTLPDGYDMVINEEASNISQGQKQLITIARAILADAPILILDEATSSVDTRTEVLIQNAMANLMQGRTSFIIAHRLSTIRNADRILFIREGRIAEQGTHDELMALNGFYRELYDSQY